MADYGFPGSTGEIIDAAERAAREVIATITDADPTGLTRKFLSRFLSDDAHNSESPVIEDDYRDKLTGLFNGVDVDHVIAQHFKPEDEVFLLYIDSDGLKEVNDTYGHDVGDGYLIAIAERLGHVDGVAFRLHGDEFLVVLPAHREMTDRRQDNITNPAAFAENVVVASIEPAVARIRDAVEHILPISLDPRGQGEAVDIEIRVSIGCVFCPDTKPHTIHGLRPLADAQMYQDKEIRRARMKQARDERELDELSGHTQFVDAYNDEGVMGRVVRREADAFLSKHGGASVATMNDLYRVNFPASQIDRLVSVLRRYGQDDAVRYLDGLTNGNPSFTPDQLRIGNTSMTLADARTLVQADWTIHR